MGRRTFRQLFGSAAPRLPADLSALAEELAPHAARIAVHRVVLEVIPQPGQTRKPRPGVEVAVLSVAARSSQQLIQGRNHDFASAGLVLTAHGFSARASGRPSDTQEERTTVGDTQWTLGRQTSNTNSPQTDITTIYFKGIPPTAHVPDGYLSKRHDVAREPIAINVNIVFNKTYMLCINIGSTVKAMATYCAQNVRDRLDRRTRVDLPQIAHSLEQLSTKWAFVGSTADYIRRIQRTLPDRAQIIAPDDAVNEVIHHLSPLMKTGGKAVFDAASGRYELDTSAGRLTIAGVKSATMKQLSIDTVNALPVGPGTIARDKVDLSPGRTLGQSLER